ncbi:hypothetical protein B0H13DRAFT_2301361 [Mycena leptocephala]|nr:hypothetical protein B0H13DRAFT_2301361 [Mycena leptocephala]
MPRSSRARSFPRPAYTFTLIVMNPPPATACEQCLRNSDLLDKIMDHVASPQDPSHLAAKRKCLWSAALTCKAFLPSATRSLWRRLDNLLPLLQLLPSFTARGGIYGLIGPIQPHEWTAFDDHAARVREIVYEDIKHPIHIDPSVYVRLAMRRSQLLPNLSRLECVSSHVFASEILMFMASPLRTVKLMGLKSTPGIGHEIFVSLLPSNVPHLSNLILINQSLTSLSEYITTEALTSLELRDMAGTLSISSIAEIGSLPHLRSLVTDFTGWSADDVAKIGSSTLFVGLTHLGIQTDENAGLSIIPGFLNKLGAENLRSLTIHSDSRLHPRQHKIYRAIFHSVTDRWTQSLQKLDLKIYYLIESVNLKLLGRLLALRSLTIQSLMTGAGVPDLLDYLFISNLNNDPIHFDVPAIALLARTCPNLQELNITVSPYGLLPLASIPTISHSLAVISVQPGGLPPDTITLARHIDQLFPRLSTVRQNGGPDEGKRAWAEVQKLLLIFQDVRRTALLQR